MTTSTSSAPSTPTRKAGPMNMHTDAAGGGRSYKPLNMHTDLRVDKTGSGIVLTGTAQGIGIVSVHLPVLLGTQIKTVVLGLRVSGPPNHCTAAAAFDYVFDGAPSVGAAQPAALVLTGLVPTGNGQSASLRVEITSDALATLRSDSGKL